MLSLRPAKHVDFEHYKPYFVADYSVEITQNYGKDIEASRRQAEAEIQHSFPEGVPLQNNYLMCIEVTHDSKLSVVGYLWFSVEPESKQAFICDFYVLESFRNTGYGKRAFKALEELLLAEHHIKVIKLRVAYTNSRALKLYNDIGFKATGINMVKWL